MIAAVSSNMGLKEKAMIKELANAGFKYADADDIFKQKVLQPDEVEIILKWIPSMYSESYGTADILVRSLMSAKMPFDPAPLIDLFENSNLNYAVKSGIGFTLGTAKTPDISKWIQDQLLNKEYALERYALVDGLYEKGGFATVSDYMEFMRKIFDKYHNNTVMSIFKKYGSKDEIKFLESKAKVVDKKLAKEISKVVTSLKKKLKID